MLFNGVSHSGFYPANFQFTFLLASAMTANMVGHAVSLDLTTNNGVKAAGDGEKLVGVLRSYEDRITEGVKTGAVAKKCGTTLKYNGVIAVGDSIVGSAVVGEVKKASAANNTTVVAVDTTAKTVEVLFE